MHDVSHGFLAKIIGEKTETKFEDHEQARGFELQWAPSLEQAIRTFENNHNISEPTAAKLQERDLAFLKRALEHLAK